MLQYNPSITGSLIVTGSINASQGITGSLSGTVDGINVTSFSSSIVSTVTSVSSSLLTVNGSTGSYATTGSNTFTGAQTVQGTLTAQTLVVQTVTSSVLFSTGSNIIGSSLSNIQQITGSLGVTGSATFSNGITIKGAASSISDGNELRFFRADNAIFTKIYDAGSLAANGFTFDNTNAEGFHFKNNGTTIMRMPSNGFVGIGTTAPNSTLSISISAYSNAGLKSYTTDNTAGVSAYVNNQDPYTGYLDIYATRSGDNSTLGGSVIRFLNQTTSTTALAVERMRISTTGNVGIGTDSPITYQNYRYLQINGSSTSQGGVVRLGTSDNSYTNELAVDSNGGYINSSSHFLLYAGSGTPRMYVNGSSGNVGIGTTSPSQKLSVGTISSGGIATSTPTCITLDDTFGNNAVGTNFKLKVFQDTASNRYGLGVSDSLLEIVAGSGGGIGFFTNSTSERMRITSGGSIDTKGNPVYAYSGAFSMGASYQTIFTAVSESVYLISVTTNPSSGDGTFALLVAMNDGDKSCSTISGNNLQIQFSGNDVQIRSTNGATYSVNWSATRLK